MSCNKKQPYIPDCPDYSKLEYRIEQAEKCCEDAHDEIDDLDDKKADEDDLQRSVARLEGHIDDAMGEINSVESRIDNLVLNSGEVRDTLWEGRAFVQNATLALNAGISDYDLLDIYYDGYDDPTVVRFVRIPVAKLANNIILDIPRYWDMDSLGNHVALYETEVTKVDNTTLKIASVGAWMWDGKVDVDAQVQTIGSKVTIYRVDGIKSGSGSSSTEVVDARTGADGTVYNTLKTRLDTEFTDLKEDITDITYALEKSDVGYINTSLSNGYWDQNAQLISYSHCVCNTEKILCPANVSVYIELRSSFPNNVIQYISYYDENNVRLKRQQATGKIYNDYSPAGTKYVCYCFEYSGMNKDNAGSVVVFVNNPILNMAGAIKASNQLMIKGSYISSLNGNAVAHSDTYCYSNFEPIWFLRNFPLSIYCCCASAYNIGLAFYDEGKNFISGYTETNTASPQKIKTTVPSNAYYVRFTGYTSFSLNTQDYYLVIEPDDVRYVPLVQNVQALAYSNLKRYEEEYAQLSNYLRFGVIGDSFASGVTASGDNYPASWGQNIARLCGITCTNYSHGGLTTKTWLTDERGLSKLNNSSADDLYFCCLGLNDFFEIFSGHYTLGTIGDIHDDSTLNPDTFYGNYGKIISAIKTHSPNAKIVMCNVTRGDDYFSSINAAIEEIAEHFEIPFINLLSDVFFTSEFYKNGMIGSHPTPIVYSAYAKAIMRLFSKCCVSYLTYFMS